MKSEVRHPTSDVNHNNESSKYKNMSLEQKITAELKTAMLAKDEKTLRSLRAIKAAILLAKTSEGAGGEIKEEDEIKMLQKLVKQRRESAEIYKTQNREELYQNEMKEAAIIEEYLPQQMGEGELVNVLKGIIQRVGATSPKDMGKVMGTASKELAGKADGKMIADKVKELLASL
jgi:uncharacterized protein YqeY